jgi:thymidine phosphorylase
MRGVGEMVDATRPIAVVHARSAANAQAAAAAVREAVTVGDGPVAAPGPPVLRRFDRPR